MNAWDLEKMSHRNPPVEQPSVDACLTFIRDTLGQKKFNEFTQELRRKHNQALSSGSRGAAKKATQTQEIKIRAKARDLGMENT